LGFLSGEGKTPMGLMGASVRLFIKSKGFLLSWQAEEARQCNKKTISASNLPKGAFYEPFEDEEAEEDDESLSLPSSRGGGV
jgi:hypothetical protein